MARIANLSLEELGKAIFSSTCGDDKSAETILKTDYKEFHIAGHDLAVGQVTCMDSERLLVRKAEFLQVMNRSEGAVPGHGDFDDHRCTAGRHAASVYRR